MLAQDKFTISMFSRLENVAISYVQLFTVIKVVDKNAVSRYSEMITTALGALKHRSGSSRQAILKYICANYKVVGTFILLFLSTS